MMYSFCGRNGIHFRNAFYFKTILIVHSKQEFHLKESVLGEEAELKHIYIYILIN